jgi:hypothetical protein
MLPIYIPSQAIRDKIRGAESVWGPEWRNAIRIAPRAPVTIDRRFV